MMLARDLDMTSATPSDRETRAAARAARLDASAALASPPGLGSARSQTQQPKRPASASPRTPKGSLKTSDAMLARDGGAAEALARATRARDRSSSKGATPGVVLRRQGGEDYDEDEDGVRMPARDRSASLSHHRRISFADKEAEEIEELRKQRPDVTDAQLAEEAHSREIARDASRAAAASRARASSCM